MERPVGLFVLVAATQHDQDAYYKSSQWDPPSHTNPVLVCAITIFRNCTRSMLPQDWKPLGFCVNLVPGVDALEKLRCQ